MQSSDPEHFFETDADQAKRERRTAKSSNKYGNPITLKSKILAAIPDPRSPSTTVLVAEAAGTVRRVNVDEGDSSLVYRGPTAPVSCIAVGGPATSLLFAGSWDKTIWSWDLATRAPGRKYAGHADFVKAVSCVRIGGKDCLISGGSDKKIIVWDIATGARLHTLQDTAVNMLAVQDLVIDPVASTADEAVLLSASSDPHIRRWRVRLDGWEQVVVPPGEDAPGAADRRTILEHETTVYRLVFDRAGDEVDLWTSSGDGTAKCLSRLRGFAASDDSFTHGGHVRAVAVTEQWVVTAGRDEDVKFWDRTAGKLYCSLAGHFDEVTDLVVLGGGVGPGSKERVCSVSIDGTVRSWPVDRGSLDTIVEEQKKPVVEEEEEDAGKDQSGQLLTAEEEAELADLMDDDD